MLKGKKIVLAVTGSIAAYKSAYLVRSLVKENAEVRVIMTPAARDFITPLTLSTLSRNPVITEPFNPSDGSWNSHVELGNWADLMIMAPVTANTMAKMAQGIADNFVLAVYLSAKCPVFFAPAMDLDMYRHPATIANINVLQSYGNILIEPQVGDLASGLSGPGRMEEPENIIRFLHSYFTKCHTLAGVRLMITAGPTYEAIDPVRFIGNFSSGRMGFALAKEAADRCGTVTLITGPTCLELNHPGIARINVVSADEMLEQCLNHMSSQDIVIMSAAVADFKPASVKDQKIKKDHKPSEIKLKPTPDILTQLGSLKNEKQFIAGFALESGHEIENAVSKLHTKNLDMIVLNSLKDQGAGFGTTTNKITIIWKDGKKKTFPLKDKGEVACDILDNIQKTLSQKRKK